MGKVNYSEAWRDATQVERDARRMPVYRVVCDDDCSDTRYPCAVSWATLAENGDSVLLDVAPLAVGESVTVGGGAATQFTLTRIR